jgi:hypothetical protein
MQPLSCAVYTRSAIAAGAVTQRRFVKVSGAQATVQGEKVLGVSKYTAPDQGDLALDVLGSSVVEAGAAVAADADVITDADGRAITATGAAGERIVGRALSVASAAGAAIEILLTP